MIKVVCAWCGKDMGYRTGRSSGLSHGICAVCYVKVRKAADIEKSDATT